MKKLIYFRQHRTIWQEHSAKDFASYESYKRAGILYVFPPFITARMGQKIGRRPQTQLCGDAFGFSCPFYDTGIGQPCKLGPWINLNQKSLSLFSADCVLLDDGCPKGTGGVPVGADCISALAGPRNHRGLDITPPGSGGYIIRPYEKAARGSVGAAFMAARTAPAVCRRPASYAPAP